MSGRPSEVPWHIFGDSVCPVHCRSRNPWASKIAPATVIDTPRPSWQENTVAYVRRVLEQLECEQVVYLFDHEVQRSDAFARFTYHVDGAKTAKGTLVRFELAEALALVVADGERGDE